MPKTAGLEIHQINVSQGDSVLIINRDLDEVETLIRGEGKQPPTDAIDYVPFAVANDISQLGSVKKALLIDGGDDEFGGDVYDYMIRHGVVDPGEVLQPTLMLLVSHYHDDHQAGLRYIFRERIEPTRKGEKFRLMERVRPGVIYQAQLDGVTDSVTNAGIWLQEHIDDAITAKPASKRSTVVWVHPGGLDDDDETTQISLGIADSGLPIDVYLLASSQYVYYKAQQNNGTVRIWALDAGNALYTNAQTSPGSDWTGWSPPSACLVATRAVMLPVPQLPRGEVTPVRASTAGPKGKAPPVRQKLLPAERGPCGRHPDHAPTTSRYPRRARGSPLILR